MKRYLFVFLATLWAGPLAAELVDVGDTPRNYCWEELGGNRLCLDDASLNGDVVVLLYNTGWCGPCNAEFSELPSKTDEFEGLPVTFISLSAEGWSSRSTPNQTFLAQWRDRHGLGAAKATYRIAASPRDAGQDFFRPAYIPNVVVLDTEGKVAFKGVNPGVPRIVQEVRRITPRPVPVPSRN